MISFTIYNKATGKEIVNLPLTFPIGESVANYERAGYQVGWEWSELEDAK